MSKGALGKLPLSAVQGPVDTLWNDLASDDGPAILEELKKFNKKQACWPSAQHVSQKSAKRLKRAGRYSAVRLAERHDPAAFYQTRDGLYIYGGFQTRVVAAATPVEAGWKCGEVRRFELTANMTGAAIKDERPQALWSSTNFCPWLAAKLAKQKGGTKGELRTDGIAELFLVEGVNGEVFVVRVRWNDGEWFVYTWPLDREWRAGRRLGSRN